MKTLLSLEQAIKNGNSVKNQRIKEQFVSKHVYANVNSMVGYILQQGYDDRNAPFNMDDIANYYSYPEFYGTFAQFDGGTREQLDAEIERLKEVGENSEELSQDQIDSLEAELSELEGLDNEPQEVFEWWIVSSYLADKLIQKGAPVIESEGIWGRTTTCQSILLDYIITEICAEMEILEGQANEWSV